MFRGMAILTLVITLIPAPTYAQWGQPPCDDDAPT